METNKKQLDNIYSIRLDDETSAQLEKLAKLYQRKPSELIRLLLVPTLIKEYAKLQFLDHKENQEPMQQAIFHQ